MMESVPIRLPQQEYVCPTLNLIPERELHSHIHSKAIGRPYSQRPPFYVFSYLLLSGYTNFPNLLPDIIGMLFSSFSGLSVITFAATVVSLTRALALILIRDPNMAGQIACADTPGHIKSTYHLQSSPFHGRGPDEVQEAYVAACAWVTAGVTMLSKRPSDPNVMAAYYPSSRS